MSSVPSIPTWSPRAVLPGRYEAWVSQSWRDAPFSSFYDRTRRLYLPSWIYPPEMLWVFKPPVLRNFILTRVHISMLNLKVSHRTKVTGLVQTWSNLLSTQAWSQRLNGRHVSLGVFSRIQIFKTATRFAIPCIVVGWFDWLESVNNNLVTVFMHHCKLH